MINKEKIRLMAQAASYESSELQRDSFARRFYKQDYIGLEKLKSKIWFTIFYAVYLLYYAVDEFYLKGADLLHYDYTGFLVNAVFGYFVLMLIVSVVTSVVHSSRYDRAKKRIDQYYELLEQINDIE